MGGTREPAGAWGAGRAGGPGEQPPKRLDNGKGRPGLPAACTRGPRACQPHPSPTRFSVGSVSGRKQKTKSRSDTAKSKLSQGATSTGTEAPSMGPSVKAREKATPMTAWGEGRLS